MKKQGQITIFLSLILVCVLGLICGLLESARTAGARWYLKMAVNSSLDSVLSGYHRDLWNCYRLFGLEFETIEDIEKTFQAYLNEYIQADNFYPMQAENATIQNLWKLTDAEGEYLEQEIKDYMKFGIWDVDLNPELAAETFFNIEETKALKELSDIYSAHTKEAHRLEKAIDNISKSLETQKAYVLACVRCLDSCDGSGFRKEAKALIGELKKMPGYVNTYEKKADQLMAVLVQSKKEFELRQEKLSEETREAVGREISRYDEYIAKDGERRKEITSFSALSDKNRVLVEAVIDEALKVEEVIDSWEGEEGEELDEDELWAPVRRRFQEFDLKKLPFQTGIKDTNTQGVLEGLQTMAGISLLDLVLPQDMEVSNKVIDKKEFPSEVLGNNLSGDGLENKDDGLASELVTRIITNEYCGKFFTHILSEEKKEIQYEMEYLISGMDTEEENLKSTLGKLLMVREGMNLIYLLADSEKRQEAQILAAAITGASGLLPLTAITTFFILGVWALGEAVSDLKILLNGQKVPLMKTRETWNLSLQSLLDMGTSGICPVQEGDQEGMDYISYLKLLLLMESSVKKYYKMMDVIQMNIRRKQPEFLIDSCAYYVDINSVICGKHVFLSPGLVKSLSTEAKLEYEMKAAASKAY